MRARHPKTRPQPPVNGPQRALALGLALALAFVAALAPDRARAQSTDPAPNAAPSDAPSDAQALESGLDGCLSSVLAAVIAGMLADNPPIGLVAACPTEPEQMAEQTERSNALARELAYYNSRLRADLATLERGAPLRAAAAEAPEARAARAGQLARAAWTKLARVDAALAANERRRADVEAQDAPEVAAWIEADALLQNERDQLKASYDRVALFAPAAD